MWSRYQIPLMTCEPEMINGRGVGMTWANVGTDSTETVHISAKHQDHSSPSQPHLLSGVPRHAQMYLGCHLASVPVVSQANYTTQLGYFLSCDFLMPFSCGASLKAFKTDKGSAVPLWFVGTYDRWEGKGFYDWFIVPYWLLFAITPSVPSPYHSC